MYHNEGGWRPDINHTDSNQLMRWRRKIEKDDHYVTQMTKTGNVSRGNCQLVLAVWLLRAFLFQMMESCIKQNNGIDIYIEYFEDVDEGTECEAPQTKTVGIMRPTQFIWLKKVCQDSIAILSKLTATSGQCQISHLKWTDKSMFKFRDCAPITKNYVVPRIVIAYCNLEFQAITEETPKPSYVFNLGKH